MLKAAAYYILILDQCLSRIVEGVGSIPAQGKSFFLLDFFLFACIFILLENEKE